MFLYCVKILVIMELSEKEVAEKIFGFLQLAGLDKKYNVSISKERAAAPLPPTVMLFQTFSDIASSELSPSACKVLFFFFAQTQYSNRVSIDQFTIAKQIGMTERTVRSAISELERANIINKVPYLKDKRRNEYFLNPLTSWKGTAEARNAFIQESDPNQLTIFGIEPKIMRELEKKKKSDLL
jgi:hypothetical protein